MSDVPASKPADASPASTIGDARMLLVLAVLLWGREMLWGASVPFFHDLRHHHYPWRAWAAREWLSGHVPFWAPVAHGFPLLADGQTGILYPPNLLLYAVLPEPLAFDWSILGHHLWAAWGAAELAKTEGRSPSSAAFAGLAYGFSGFLVSHLVYLGMFEVIAWVPWMALLAIRAARGERRAWAWGALATGMAWLAGHPQMALYATWIAVFAGLWELWRRRRAAPPVAAGGLAGGASIEGAASETLAATKAAPWRGVLGLGTMLVLGALVASPQILASAELANFGLREGGLPADVAESGALPPEELVHGVFPSLLGFERPADVPITYDHKGGAYAGRGVSYWEDCFYLGIPAVLCALVAFPSRRARGWILLGALGLLFALGPSTPAFAVLRLLPGAGWFRYPVRGVIATVLATSQLAALGLDQATDWLARKPDRARAWGRVVAVAVLIGLAAIGVAGAALRAQQDDVRVTIAAHLVRPGVPGDALHPPVEARGPKEARQRADAIVDQLLADLDVTSTRVAWPAWLALGWALVLMWASRGMLPPTSPGRLFPVLLFGDLFAFGGDFDPRTPVDDVTTRPESAAVPLGDATGPYRVTVLDRRQPIGLDRDLMSSNLGLLWGFEDVVIPSPLRMVRNEAWLAAEGLDLGLEPGDEKVAAFLRGRALADVSGVRYLYTTRDLDLPDLTPIWKDGAVRVYRNERAFPRAFPVGCTKTSSDPLADVLAVDAHGTAIVEGAGLATCSPGPVGTVAVAQDGPGYAIDADLDADGWLVVTETWYPGWVFTVDGVDVAPTRTDDLFQGVALPPGHHRVTLGYRPLKLELALAGATMLAAGLLAMGAARRGA